MPYDLDLAEIEQRLFSKPVDTWTPDEWWKFLATAQRLVDDYGKESVLAAVNELALLDVGYARTIADVIRHSTRAT